MATSLDMCRPIISLSRIIHEMWHDHPFKATKTAVGWRLGGGERLDIILKSRVGKMAGGGRG